MIGTLSLTFDLVASSCVSPSRKEEVVTENAERHTFKAPCCCFENATYTELTIVCTINVSIDGNWNEVSSPNERRNILY